MIQGAIPDSPERPGSSLPGHESAQIGAEGGPEAVRAAPARDVRLRRLLRELALGYAYWLAFLLLLEPGNLVGVVRNGVPLAWTDELLRIGGAALLGALVTPLMLQLTRRMPIEGPRWPGRALLHAGVVIALSMILITAAQALAGWLLAGRDPRLQGTLTEELATNGALLVLAMAAFTAIAHAVRFLRRAQREGEQLAVALQRTAAGPATAIPVKTRGGVLLLPLAEVDWIETQGNYLALHAGPKVHLIRETLARFETQLDPRQFVRIHRRTIVRADRVRTLTRLTNGDAAVGLADGTELRLSRGYSAPAQRAFAIKPGAASPSRAALS